MLFFCNNKFFLFSFSLFVSQSIACMNIAGDIEPIIISSHEHGEKWPVAIPGDCSPCYENYEKNFINIPNVIINSKIYYPKIKNENSENVLYAKNFFHYKDINPLIAWGILNKNPEFNIHNFKSDFLDMLRKLSPNKYISYVNLLKKYAEKARLDDKHLLDLLNTYYESENKPTDHLELFTHLKVYYYKKIKIDKAVPLSKKEFDYLTKLNKKYTGPLNQQYVCVEKTPLEILQYLKDNHLQYFFVHLSCHYAIATNGLVLSAEYIGAHFTTRDFIEFLAEYTLLDLMLFRANMINNTNNFNVITFSPNVN